MPQQTGAALARGQQLRVALTKRRAVDFCRVATALCPTAEGRR